jgi:hypothetical protein
VENERKKYELSAATLFDVLLAEDNLTGALLSGVEGRLGHALALARIRYETATLVDVAGPEPAFLASSAGALP